MIWISVVRNMAQSASYKLNSTCLWIQIHQRTVDMYGIQSYTVDLALEHIRDHSGS